MGLAMTQTEQPNTDVQIAAPRYKFQLTSSVALKGAHIALTTLFVAMLIAALHPEIRSTIRKQLVSYPRTVVSTVTGDLRGDGSVLTVVKVKLENALALEIYDRENEMPKLIGRIEIRNAKDGFFNFNGQTANLAIDDINGDGINEVLAPTFDTNMVGHLNVFRFDAGSQNLKVVTAAN